MRVCLDNSQTTHWTLKSLQTLFKGGNNQHKYWKLAYPRQACHKSKVLKEKTYLLESGMTKLWETSKTIACKLEDNPEGAARAPK